MMKKNKETVGVIVRHIVVAGSTNLIAHLMNFTLERELEEETDEFVEEAEAHV